MSSATSGDRDSTITTEDFINHPDVINCIDQLNNFFSQANHPFIVSDVYDDDGNQYVNLVQKGGGVLGVALVGYTYILEKMGVRFVRLAGTSAGAINTALMTVIGEKENAKSIPILEAICELDFFKLVDGHPAARWIIKNFITHEDFAFKVKKWIKRSLLIGIILFVADYIFLGLQHSIPSVAIFTQIVYVLSGLYIFAISLILFYSSRLLKRLKTSGFGINPGNYFYDWIKARLKENGVNTVTELKAKASALPNLRLRSDNPEKIETLTADVTFIASELVTQNKIQFPAMCNLFREEAHIDELSPAGFVRASMAIPIFFESYFINKIPCESPEIRKAWMDTMNEPDPPSATRFVDGGILSNFPINIFYNPKVTVPRLPSFGIDLDDSKPDNESKDPANWTIIGYFGRMFNTIRFYYDKDFLLKNKMYEKGIGKVPLAGYNWLNFFISDKDKIEMFVAGAKAATQFLLEFNWNDYKAARVNMQKTLTQEKPELEVETEKNNM
jgi:NTE family protein